MAATLNLSTTDFTRPTVTIDGEEWELRSPEEFSTEMALKQRRLRQRRDEYGAEIDGVFTLREELTDEEFEEFMNLSRDSLRIIMVEPTDEMLARLGHVHVKKINQHWSQLFIEAVGDAKPTS